VVTWQLIVDASVSLWRPLRTPIFRNLLIADVMSDIGTFMQTVGAAWLMLSLGAGPMYVALTQTASALPFFVFALPAGAIGDILDRRRLILYTEFWMVGVATVLAVVTIGGFMSPWLLLGLTFALSAGDAIETPTWRAILPELVKKEDLAAARPTSGISFLPTDRHKRAARQWFERKDFVPHRLRPFDGGSSRCLRASA